MPASTLTSDPSLPALLRKLWAHLSSRRRAQLGAAALLLLVSSLAEVVSLAAVLPFLAVLTNPDTLWSKPLVQQWGLNLGITNAQGLLLPITFGFAAAAIISGAIRLLTLWLNGRLAAAIGSDWSCEVYRRTLYQPYEVHLARNSSDLIASMNIDVSIVIGQVLNPLLQLISSALIVLALVGTLLVIDWLVAVGAGLVIGLVYAVAIAGSSLPLQHLSQRQVMLNRQLIQALQEGLGAIRDVLLDGSQIYYAKTYREADQQLRRNQAKGSFLTIYPRLLMEPAGTVFLALLGYWLVLHGGVARVLPLLGLLALAAQRMLPMAQKVYEGWAQIRNATQSLVKVLDLLAQPLPPDTTLSLREPLSFGQSIALERIHFRYGSEFREVIQGIDLEIHRGDRIGLIGSTGSGKSTLVDLIMGLLKPTQGRILIDGDDIHQVGRIAAWKATIAHVPQSIYLADTSIIENIAFGIPKEQIQLKRVRQVAEQAQIASFIESTPDGYDTFVGERGIRLSGGQRQRLGIARALYKRAQVLVLDEATAALDNSTEQAVMESVEGLTRDLTIIIIAHRLSTVRRCDRIIKLEQGIIIGDDLPDKLLGNHWIHGV